MEHSKIILARCHELLKLLEKHEDTIVAQKARILQRQIESLVEGLN